MTAADEGSSILNRLSGWITTRAQASATFGGAFLLGGSDAALNVFPHADALASAGLGGIGGAAIMLGVQSIGAARADARERRRLAEEHEREERVLGLTQRLADKGYLKFAYALADDYDNYLHGGGVTKVELEDWMNALRDFLRSERPPRLIS